MKKVLVISTNFRKNRNSDTFGFSDVGDIGNDHDVLHEAYNMGKAV